MIIAIWLPSFALSWGTSIAGLLAFVLWIFLDCAFPQTATFFGQDLRLRFLRDPILRYYHRWSWYGARLTVFAVLAGLSLAATLVAVVRPFFAYEKRPSLSVMFLAAMLIVIWISLFVGYRRLWWKAFRYRIFRFQPALQAAVPILREHWPDKEIELPGFGKYTVNDRDPSTLFSERPCSPFPFREMVATIIGRTLEGDLRFDVNSDASWRIAHQHDGRMPLEVRVRDAGIYTATWRRDYCWQYAPGWFLVRSVMTSFESKDGVLPEVAAEIARRPAGMRLPRKGGRFRVTVDLDVEISIWSYFPAGYDFGSKVVEKPRKRHTAPDPPRHGTLPKGEVLRLHYHVDPAKSTHCELAPEHYEELELEFVDAKTRRDRDYSHYSILLSYVELDKNFEWLE